ncbi:hypothetical protein BH23ACT12_BH23ACT12_10910 [soil metagenome]
MEIPPHSVYLIEMKPFGKFSDQDLDRLFSGRAPAGSSGLDDVSRLVQKVQSHYLTDVEPELETSHLAALMQLVNLTDKGDLAVRPASKVNGPARQASGLPKRRRRFVLESLLATFASKLALGSVAVALAATGGLAGTGNLPDRAQTAISQAVDNVGINIPLGNTAQEAADQARRIAGQAAAAALEKAEAGRAAEQSASVAGDAPNANADFGQGVASDAKDAGVNQTINDVARDQAEERRAEGQAHRPDTAGPPVIGGLPDAGSPAGSGSESQSGLGYAGDTPGGSQIPTSAPGGQTSGVGGGRPW